MNVRFLTRSRRRAVAAAALLASFAAHAADNVTVTTQTYTTTQTVQADNKITTSGSVVVANGANVTFRAGAGLSLATGFKINAGGLFHTDVGQVFPYLVGFESSEGFSSGSLHLQRGWSVWAGDVQIGTAGAHAGSWGATVGAGGRTTQGFAVNTAAVVFIDLYALPAAAAAAGDSSVVQTESAQVGFQLTNGQGQVYSFDGVGANQWLPTGVRFSVNGSNQATDWLRLTIRADYTHQKWDLYVNGVLADYDLAFTSNTETALRLLALSASAGASAAFDELKVQTTNPLFTDADKDGMPDAWETAFGLNTAADDRNSDPDGDGFTNIEEYFRGTYPTSGSLADSDSDGVPDIVELQLGTNQASATAADTTNQAQLKMHRPNP